MKIWVVQKVVEWVRAGDWNFDVYCLVQSGPNLKPHLLGKQPFNTGRSQKKRFFFVLKGGSLLSLISIATCSNLSCVGLCKHIYQLPVDVSFHDCGVPEALQKSLLGEDEDGWVEVTLLKD